MEKEGNKPSKDETSNAKCFYCDYCDSEGDRNSIRQTAKNEWNHPESLGVLDDVLCGAGYKKHGDYRRWILTRLSELTGETHYLD